ncbi:MAG: hypothetical protein VKP62_02400 [Candidatus Sericytochromatia bacterium]|nr:hypothetical protein [Candidatus Sericytochromatia bacterium]
MITSRGSGFLGRTGFRAACAVALPLLLSGCWWLRVLPFHPHANTRVSQWGLNRLAVVDFADATFQGMGARVAAGFADELRQAFGPFAVVAIAGQGPDVGLLGIHQARRLGAQHHVDALLTGQVLAFRRADPVVGCELVVALRLLDANRGSIIWSRTADGRTGPALAVDQQDQAATALAAKEFLDDLLAPRLPNQSLRPGSGRKPAPAG